MSAHQNDDAGITFIELLVYLVLLGIFSAVFVTIFVNTWTAQASVSSQTRATMRGQLVSSEIERAMRNAVAFTISPDGSTLQVRTSLTGSRECQAFALSASGARMIVSTSPVTSSVWPIWQDRIAQSGTTPFFEPIDSTGVTYTFDSTSDSAPVHFTGDANMRNAAEGTMAPCW
ncbi:prepilin-type N-terminal cleavage/methylation domain-containing protein [Microbacterium deminutum]|uniref:Type II secretion system protein n=1 Tax=Microbacterium deminutum TaxID=344164 RepID=A0ABP5BM49_9MICO